jgi:hypothetical protein
MSDIDIEEYYQNEKNAINEELKVELELGEGHYTERANELYAELRSLREWYKEAKYKV